MAEQLGHYKILDRVGGGVAEVYRARDMRVGRTVAIKALPLDLDAEQRSRLLLQAQRVATLSHPNIATLYEIGDEDGLYFVFEFVPGQTITTLVASGPLNARLAIELAVKIADALADAHARGITHGGLTPNRAIVTPNGNAKVLDFGFGDWTGRLSHLAVDDEVAVRDDLAALGGMLFLMLTGHEVGSGLLTLGGLNRSVPRELGPIVVKAIGRGESSGYTSAAALAADLRRVAAVLEERFVAAPPPAADRARAPLLWVAAALTLGAILVALWWRL